MAANPLHQGVGGPDGRSSQRKPSTVRSSGSPPFVSDFGKTAVRQIASIATGRQKLQPYAVLHAFLWFASILIEAVRQVVAVKVEAFKVEALGDGVSIWAVISFSTSGEVEALNEVVTVEGAVAV